MTQNSMHEDEDSKIILEKRYSRKITGCMLFVLPVMARYRTCKLASILCRWNFMAYFFCYFWESIFAPIFLIAKIS